jgi:hypothetical protein
VRPHNSLGYLTPEEFRMGYANVESKNRFPHSHSPDGGGKISLLTQPRALSATRTKSRGQLTIQTGKFTPLQSAAHPR